MACFGLPRKKQDSLAPSGSHQRVFLFISTGRAASSRHHTCYRTSLEASMGWGGQAKQLPRGIQFDRAAPTTSAIGISHATGRSTESSGLFLIQIVSTKFESESPEYRTGADRKTKPVSCLMLRPVALATAMTLAPLIGRARCRRGHPTATALVFSFLPALRFCREGRKKVVWVADHAIEEGAGCEMAGTLWTVGATDQAAALTRSQAFSRPARHQPVVTTCRKKRPGMLPHMPGQTEADKYHIVSRR